MNADDDEGIRLAKSVDADSSGAVELVLAGAVAEIVLSRPEKLNAINGDVLAGIRTAMHALEDQRGIRAIIVRGEGRCFSAGGDLAEVKELTREPTRFDGFLDQWHATLGLLEQSDLPTIAAVHGLAFAGGLELVEVCDLVVVGDRTRIGDQHAMFGLFPAGGSTQRLPRLVGRRAAAWLLMTGEEIQPAEALALGLVNRVVHEDLVLEEARRMAATLATKSRTATAAIKADMRVGSDRRLTDALTFERPIAVSHMASADAQTGFAAFESRTTPDFTQ
jgi:enoyl-CoA hydratase/carnithine racemase